MIFENIDVYWGPIRLVCWRFWRLTKQRKLFVLDDRFHRRGRHMVNGIDMCFDCIKTLCVKNSCVEYDVSCVNLMNGLSMVHFMGCEFETCEKVLENIRANILIVRFEDCSITDEWKGIGRKLEEMRVNSVELVMCRGSRKNIENFIEVEWDKKDRFDKMCCSGRIYLGNNGKKIEWDYLGIGISDIRFGDMCRVKEISLNSVDNIVWTEWTNLLKVKLWNLKGDINWEGLESSQIQELEIGYCYGLERLEIERMENLISLQLICCGAITSNERELERIGSLKRLKKLRLQHSNEITNVGFVGKLEELETFIVRRNPRLQLVEHKRPIGWENLIYCKKLKILELENEHLEEDIFAIFSTHKLKKLKLDSCWIVDSDITNLIHGLCCLTLLEELNVSNCKWFGNDELKIITESMKRLRYLNLCVTRVLNLNCLDNLRELDTIETNGNIEGYENLKFTRLHRWMLRNDRTNTSEKIQKLFEFVMLIS